MTAPSRTGHLSTSIIQSFEIKRICPQKTFWTTADKLRATMEAAEYKHLVLSLIFVT